MFFIINQQSRADGFLSNQPKEGFRLPACHQSVKSPGDNLGLRLASEVVGAGSRLTEHNTYPADSDAISGGECPNRAEGKDASWYHGAYWQGRDTLHHVEIGPSEPL